MLNSQIILFILLAIIVLLIGLRAGRNQDDSGYNIYGRKLSKLGFTVSYTATFIGAGFFITGTGYAYRYGFNMLWLLFGALVGIIIFGWFSSWLKAKTEREDFYNLPDYYGRRFGYKASLALTVVTVLLLLGDISMQLIGGGKLLVSLGISGYATSVIFTSGIVATYLVVSGFRSVVWTDYILIVAILILTYVLVVFSLNHTHLALHRTDASLMPTLDIIGFTIFGIFGPFALTTAYQRIFASKSPIVAKRATWLSSIPLVATGVGLLFIGLAARVLFPSIDPDTAFLKITEYGGKWQSMLGAMALWAALVSTLDTLVFAASQIITKDIFNLPLKKKNVRIGICAILILGCVVSNLFPSITAVALMFIAGQMAIAPSAFCSWFLTDLQPISVTLSLAVGVAALVAWSVFVGVSPVLAGVTFITSFGTLLITNSIAATSPRLRSIR